MKDSSYVVAGAPAPRASWLPVVAPALVGAAFLVVALLGRSLWIGLAGALFVAFAVLVWRFRGRAVGAVPVTAHLLDDRLELSQGGNRQSLRWAEVIAVREDGDILRFERGDGDGVGLVVDPAWPQRADFVEDVARHLDASRGYSNRVCEFDPPAAPEGSGCQSPLGCAGQGGCQGHALAGA